MVLPQTRGEDLILESLAQQYLYGPKLRPTMRTTNLIYHSNIEKDTILRGQED